MTLNLYNGGMKEMKYAYPDHRFELKVADSNRSLAYLNQAAKLAIQSDCKHRIGAILVRGGSVLSRGFNKIQNDFVSMDAVVYDDFAPYATSHAEMNALSRAKNPFGATIYVVKVDKRGMLRNAKPCIDCAKALDAAGVAKVVYLDQ